MIPQIQQTIAYQINLPQFVKSFKQQVIGAIIPHLLELKAFINSQKNSSTVNPLILVLSILVVVYVLKSIWSGLFGKRQDQTQSSGKDSPQLNTQVNQLKKQLKSLKTSFNQLVKQVPNQKLSYSQQNVNISSSSSTKHQSELWAQVLPLYTISLQNNKKLVNYVLESQFQMLKELKRFKKSQRASLSSGRPSTSTIRSKTSDKKNQNSLSKSPLKTPINTTSSIKKLQIKTTDKHVRSQIQEKVHTRTQENFLIKGESPKIQIKTKIINESKTLSESINVQVKQDIIQKSFEKVQKSSKQSSTILSQQQQIIISNSSKIQSPQKVVHQQMQTKHTSHTEQTQFSVKQQSLSRELPSQKEPQLFQTNLDPNTQNMQISNDQLLSQGVDSQQIQESKVFVPLKLPVIKKMIPPKQGGKRAPPPPPKK